MVYPGSPSFSSLSPWSTTTFKVTTGEPPGKEKKYNLTGMASKTQKLGWGWVGQCICELAWAHTKLQITVGHWSSSEQEAAMADQSHFC